MNDGPPDLIAIDHDDHHARHIGRTKDGRQFFLTSPFVPAMGGRAGCEYVALYVFDDRGLLLSATIEDFGPRGSPKNKDIDPCFEAMLRGLGDVSLERITVAPFQVERFGEIFGLVLRGPENDDDMWAVEIQPGNYMAFFEPWDSGEYDT